VDHIIPHQGDMEVFWDDSQWQALCVSCHARKTRRESSSRQTTPGA
jgi:5-methylcytosine-specific restriction protein A